MSTSYRTRKKAIRDEKKRRKMIPGPNGLDSKGHIPEKAFSYLQADWHSKVIGPPIGTLEDLMKAKSL